MSIFIIIVLSIIILQIDASSLRTSTSERIARFESSRFKPQVTDLNGKLIYASFLSYPDSKIRFESEEISAELCDVSFPSIELIEYFLGFSRLGNGKLLLSVLFAKGSYEHSNYPQARFINTFIVDFANCTTRIAVTTLEQNSTHSWDYRASITVEPGKDEFDIFMTSHEDCNSTEACRFRYNDNGVFIGKTDFQRPGQGSSWSIRSVQEKDFSQGFFYTVSVNGSTILKILDQDLKTQNEKKLKHSSFLLSDHKGRINRCFGISSEELECEFFDELLLRRSQVSVDTRPYRHNIRNMKLLNLEDGSALLMFVLQLYTEPTDVVNFSVYLHHLDVHSYGKIIRPFTKFHEDICKDSSDLKIMKMKENFYCIGFSCRDTVHTKCILVSQY